MDINTLTIDDARSLVESRELPRTPWPRRTTPRLKAAMRTIGSFLSLTRERALAQADRIDRLAEKGDPLPPLAGVPVGHQGRADDAWRAHHGWLALP